ncbi:MAG: DUF167 domain-containing protein [Candidatus Sulfotelmatobacter sp.]
MIFVQRSNGGVSFAVKVHPRARTNAITGEFGDALKVSLTAPPNDGKANAACAELFAKLLKVPRASVTIASGQTSRSKMVRVVGLSVDELRKRMGFDVTQVNLGRSKLGKQTRAGVPAPHERLGRNS